MSRYIDADAFERRCMFDKNIEDMQDVIYALRDFPTIDAEPVKRGMWIKADSQQYFRKHYPCFTCSECGYRKESQKTWNYCPNCGARMGKE